MCKALPHWRDIQGKKKAPIDTVFIQKKMSRWISVNWVFVMLEPSYHPQQAIPLCSKTMFMGKTWTIPNAHLQAHHSSRIEIILEVRQNACLLLSYHSFQIQPPKINMESEHKPCKRSSSFPGSTLNFRSCSHHTKSFRRTFCTSETFIHCRKASPAVWMSGQ